MPKQQRDLPNLLRNTEGSRRGRDYASLAPGRYRFHARAVDGDGMTGEPAVVAFAIQPPVWQRAWFVALCAAALAALAAAAYRYRIARVRELERVRTRIATDLHDDVGSGLTYISMVSDLARRRSAGSPAAVEDTRGRIATDASELVDSMSDIVWAINPAKDTFADLVQRMRWFAAGLCEAREIELSFSAPDGASRLELPAEQRKQVYLLFKEAITNLARHSGCRKASVRVECWRDRLRVFLEDDGKGFPETMRESGGGLGLVSMQQRAARAGRAVEFRSRAGASGTEVRIDLPIHGSRLRQPSSRSREGPS
jgi:signal transduction histidine kinase